MGENVVHSVMSDFLPSHGLEPARLLCPWDSPGENTGAGCHFLLQGIFLTQGLNLRFFNLLRVTVFDDGNGIWEGGIWRETAAAAAAASLQSCPTLRDPIDGSPPGSTIPGII